MTIGKILSVLGLSILTMSKDILKVLTTFNFQSNADYIGTFVIVYLSLGGGFVFSMMLLGINPTLVLSVIAAPVWIYIVFTANRVTKYIVTKKKGNK
jgi:hypothetical protein